LITAASVCFKKQYLPSEHVPAPARSPSRLTCHLKKNRLKPWWTTT